MPQDVVGEFLYLARFSLVSWLFTVAGVIMVVSRPRWPGSWWLLVGAMFSSALVGVRLLGFVPRDASVWVWIGYEAGETLAFILTGAGVLMVSMRQRRETADSPALAPSSPAPSSGTR
ncbi:MAG TPA: hypothetical protein VHL85_03325 [Burkholderiales bacterium]|jgi:hypothetical protein|nr:hypothetical protein [Burkholderiales bacterium]